MERVKIKTMRESFEENYQAVSVPANNKKGFKIRYVYTGAWMVCREDGALVRRIKHYIISACAVCLILYFAASLRNSPVNAARGVSIFGLLSLVPYVFLLFGAVQFAVSKEKLTVSSHSDITVRILASSVIYAALLAVCGVLSVIAALKSGSGAGGCLIGACYLLSAAGAVTIALAFRKLHFIKVENDAAGTYANAIEPARK